ncbi:ribosomal protein L7Ae/L30e/S12e/Gadd45 [Tanacetum coccineum]
MGQNTNREFMGCDSICLLRRYGHVYTIQLPCWCGTYGEKLLNDQSNFQRCIKVYANTIGDPEKYRIQPSKIFPSVKFTVAKKANSLYAVVSGSSIVTKEAPGPSLASLALMLYCKLLQRKFNLAYFFFKRIECARATPKITISSLWHVAIDCLFRTFMEHYPHLGNDIYNVVDRVMRPLALKQTQKPQSDHGMPKACHSVSSSSAYLYGSSSHHEDDDEDDDASRAITPSPTTYLNSLLPLNYQRYDISTSS